jgi:hypothetical protein
MLHIGATGRKEDGKWRRSLTRTVIIGPSNVNFAGKSIGHYYIEDGKVTVWCQFGSDSVIVQNNDAPERALTMLLELLKRAHYAGRI